MYTRNATEAINLVANTWGAANLREGDEVILSVAEHHSNLVPWQLLAQRKGLVLKCVRGGEGALLLLAALWLLGCSCCTWLLGHAGSSRWL